MALTKIKADGLTADLIDETKLADNSIDSEHYNDGSIDNAHLADDAVGVAELSATGTASSSTFLRGDNSWAAVTSTTINNNADNRVITGSGTANTLEGESGLTYDSTTLVVSGSGEVKALSHTADNTDKKALFTTGHRDTSEENVSGVVVQGADGDNMVDIGGGQGSYNSATKIRFYTGANAATTTGTERMRINPDGNVGIGTSTPTASNAAYNSATLHLHQTGSSSAGSQVHLTTGASGQGIADGSILAQYSDNNLYINNQESGNIQFYTGGASRARLDSDGLKFGTDTAAANALDDYEEGTFTPDWNGSSAGTTTYSTNQGSYTKIGNIVHIRIYSGINGTTGTGGWEVKNLPFASPDSLNAITTGSCMTDDLNWENNYTCVVPYKNANSTLLHLYASKDNDGWDQVQISDDSSFAIILGITYKAAQTELRLKTKPKPVLIGD